MIAEPQQIDGTFKIVSDRNHGNDGHEVQCKQPVPQRAISIFPSSASTRDCAARSRSLPPRDGRIDWAGRKAECERGEVNDANAPVDLACRGRAVHLHRVRAQGHAV